MVILRMYSTTHNELDILIAHLTCAHCAQMYLPSATRPIEYKALHFAHYFKPKLYLKQLAILESAKPRISRFHKWIHTCGFNLFNLFFRGWRLFQTTWSPPAGSPTPYDTSITFIAFNTPSAWMVTGVSLVVSINNHTSEKRALKLNATPIYRTDFVLWNYTEVIYFRAPDFKRHRDKLTRRDCLLWSPSTAQQWVARCPVEL